MAGDAFTRDKLQWLDRVAEDGRVSAGAFRLAYVLASRFLSRQQGVAFPSQETLGALLHASERHVRRFTSELTAAGHLRVRRGGKGRSNRYALSVADRTDMSAQDRVSLEGRPDIFVRSGDVDRTDTSGQTGHTCPPNPLKEPMGGSGAPGGAPASPAPYGAGGDFQTFSETYPKPVDPSLAPLFAEIVRSGVATTDEIIEGARRAAERGSFATAAGHWLRGQGWRKERPKRAPSKSRRPSGRRGSMLESVLSDYAEGSE